MSLERVVVFGEALVDEFHDRAVAGGAPFNVARSLAWLGVPTAFISRLGAADEAAALLRASARRFGLPDRGMQRDLLRPSGRVTVREAAGTHNFVIHEDAAWDHIDLHEAEQVLGERASGWLYFGTLAQRSPVSRASLRALVKGSSATRLLDLNLRDGPDAQALAAESLMLADWLKVNEDELRQLRAWFAPSLPAAATEAAVVRALVQRFGLMRLVLTRGAAGWALFGAEAELLAQGPGIANVPVVDTVGAGDGFTAVLLAGLAGGKDHAATLNLANRYAAALCGVRGPLPEDPEPLATWRTALQGLPAVHS